MRGCACQVVTLALCGVACDVAIADVAVERGALDARYDGRYALQCDRAEFSFRFYARGRRQSFELPVPCTLPAPLDRDRLVLDIAGACAGVAWSSTACRDLAGTLADVAVAMNRDLLGLVPGDVDVLLDTDAGGAPAGHRYATFTHHTAEGARALRYTVNVNGGPLTPYLAGTFGANDSLTNHAAGALPHMTCSEWHDRSEPTGRIDSGMGSMQMNLGAMHMWNCSAGPAGQTYPSQVGVYYSASLSGRR